ncbi:MAG: PEGA domain-containing protein [Deltaproteobacteria bacterium]|nr:PEGA domain-containing protein [Deltaproteobacteria bacterium]
MRKIFSQTVFIKFLFFMVFITPVDAKNLQKAKTHYETAEKHYSVGEFSEALENYKSSFDLSDKPELLFNIAQCHRQLKQYEKSIFFYRLFLSRLPHTALKSEVEKHISEMNKILKSLPAGNSGRLSIVTQPRGASIFIDAFSGKRVGVTPKVINLTPGEHLVIIRKKGFSEIQKKVTVTQGALVTMDIKLEALSPDGKSKPDEIIIPKGKKSVFTSWKFITGASLSAVLILGAVYTGVTALGYEDDFKAETNPMNREDLKSTGKNYALATDILLGAGVVSIGITVAVVLMDKNGKKTDEKSASFMPLCTHNGCSIMAGFRF